MEEKLISSLDQPREVALDQIAELDDESRRNLGAVLLSCLSARQRQVYFLHHGVIKPRMSHKQIARHLDLTEAEVNEIYYQAEMQIRNLIDNLTDLLEETPNRVHRALHIWAAN